jgi:glycosyltransferase involved in cell wall biosynthesis
LPHGNLVVTVGSHVISKGHGEFARGVRALGRERAVSGVIVAPPRHGLDALRGCNPICRARGRLTSSLELLDGSPAGVAADAIAAADLFMFTSKLESGPLVILEAMAAGTPWVSYDVGHARELAGGIVTGGFSELIAAAGRILDGEHPGLGAAGHEAWEAHHRWPEIVARYESVFGEVLGRPLVGA